MTKEIEKNGIPIVTEQPSNYLTSAEFAAEVGHVPQTIMYAYRRDRFAKKKLLWWDRPSIQLTLLIHKDQIPAYKANCRLTKPGPKAKKKKKEKTVSVDPALVNGDQTVEWESRDPFQYDDVVPVKLLKEQIETRRKALELRKAQNSVVDYEEVAKAWAEVAMQVRQSILSVVPRLASRVAAEKEVHKCHELLKRELTEALLELSRLDRVYKGD